MKKSKAVTKADVRKEIKNIVKILNSGGPYAEQFWAILSALRGPDESQGSALKYSTTSRIRGLIGIKHNNAGGAVIREMPLHENDMKSRDELLERAQYHFKHHYNEAVKAIQDLYRVNLRTETCIGPRVVFEYDLQGSGKKKILKKVIK